jgi:hypothetical protein
MTTVYDSNNPVVRYVEDNLWGNPEENHQHQVKLVRISDEYGVTLNWSYMGKWRTLPKRDTFYHVFSVGGLHPGYWNIKNAVLNRNPLDRWVNVAALLKVRGVQLDIYNTRGFQYSRAHAWAMVTYDGLVLIALQKLGSYKIPSKDDMFFRCYQASVGVDYGDSALDNSHNPYNYQTMTYENASELAAFTSLYSKFKALPGYTGCFHNGVFHDGAPNTLTNLVVGDTVEVWHDPTVIRVERYAYNTLRDYYSSLDKKRKLILHPPKVDGDFTFRYFDDNDYYLVGPKGKGLYLHRNSNTTVRQLTHADVAVADDAIQGASEFHADLKDLSQVKVVVLVRETDWHHQWPHEHQRIRYLYRLDDVGIVKAMTGERATVPEWTADGLESGTVMALTRAQYPAVKRENASLALGYNAATRVVSETPVRVSFSEQGTRGFEVPPTYRKSFTAWEYDAEGLLLGSMNQKNVRYYAPKYSGCVMVEFTFGQTGRQVDYLITNQDVTLDPEVDFRVYKSAYNVDLQTVVGELTDITGNDRFYEVIDGVIKWKALDQVNERGVLLFNSASLSYTFELDHMDHSLAFALTVIYEDGGLIFPISFAQVDVWLNRHPLVDFVDWMYKDKYIYIHNKEFIVDGPQTITVRAHGFHNDQDTPKFETELGFVQGGVIGNFDRYNLRDDRVTRTVINGALYLTDEVPNAETRSGADLAASLNGKPYMVKHVYAPVKFIEPYATYPLYQRSRDVDQRVSDYLTEWLEKPNAPPKVLPTLQDKYRLYSPFLNVITNGLINRFIELPELAEDSSVFTEQAIRDLVKPYLWWLEYDPVQLGYDRRYFAIMPFANVGKLTMTSNELLFIKQVNDSYLQSVCVIEGHYEVNDNVR